MSSIFKIIGSYKRKSCFMLPRFFKMLIGSCSYGDDDDDDYKYDYAPATYLEIGVGDYDGHYNYTPTTSLEGDNNDVDRDYDYAPAAGDVIV
ncbi:hypothetical protein H5410_059540 [Solanum commersonii]|uniref:Uncharacterized protein n=1 Tax=Solanum commersonii TaxID=4109 RepID=A0A9J5W3S7_SOLCO|nr:hypothetical protein H5410_059540 [Solanum commersonii]